MRCRTRRLLPTQCKVCGYDLRGHANNARIVCPECGNVADTAIVTIEPQTSRRAAALRRFVLWARRGATGVSTIVLVLAMMMFLLSVESQKYLYYRKSFTVAIVASRGDFAIVYVPTESSKSISGGTYAPANGKPTWWDAGFGAVDFESAMDDLWENQNRDLHKAFPYEFGSMTGSYNGNLEEIWPRREFMRWDSRAYYLRIPWWLAIGACAILPASAAARRIVRIVPHAHVT